MKLAAAVFHFFGNPRWLYDLSDEDGRQECNKCHHETIADIIHDIQKLPGTAVWKECFHIKNAVAQYNRDLALRDYICSDYACSADKENSE